MSNKRVAHLLLVVVVLTFLSGCSGAKEEDIIGTWNYTSYDAHNSELAKTEAELLLISGTSITFNDDMTYTQTAGYETYTGKWKISFFGVELKSDTPNMWGEDTAELKYKDNRLILETLLGSDLFFVK